MNQKNFARGSFTVEGAILFPILFLLIAIAIQLAISLFEEIREDYEPQKVEELWEVEDFYLYQGSGEVMEDLKGEFGYD